MKDLYKKIKDSLFLTLNKLEEKETYINNLNVFPVPDGDTGTNMYKTLKETVESIESHDDDDFLKNFKEKIILKAHGNSGIIFSQFLKGFIEKILSNSLDDFEKIKRGFERGYKFSYEILDNPIEGTILTVIKEALKGLKSSKNINEGIKKAYLFGVDALEKTPEILPILKDAHVVDAGGEGFVLFLESLLYIFNNESYKREMIKIDDLSLSIRRKRSNFRYCVEAFIKNECEIPDLKRKLKKYGNSIIVIKEKDELKIHIHTNKIDEIKDFFDTIGEVKEIIIRDMRKQQLKFLSDTKIGIVTFSLSDKISDLLYSLGSSVVLDLNEKPSLEEILETINDIPNDEILILPNDKDLNLSIKKLKDLTNKKIENIETNFITEAVQALLNFNNSLSFEENVKNMKDSISSLNSGYIAKAEKSVKLRDLEINKGDYFLNDKKGIVLKNSDPTSLFMKFLKELNKSIEEIILIYGSDIDFSLKEELRFKILKEYSSVDLITYDGDQKIYTIIFSVK